MAPPAFAFSPSPPRCGLQTRRPAGQATTVSHGETELMKKPDKMAGGTPEARKQTKAAPGRSSSGRLLIGTCR
jgi:hypothetical protein